MDAHAHKDADQLQKAAAFLQERPSVLKMLSDPQTRDFIDTLGDQGLKRIAFLAKNPWLDLERVVRIADNIVNISPETSQEDLLQILCRDTALICEAQSATPK